MKQTKTRKQILKLLMSTAVIAVSVLALAVGAMAQGTGVNTTQTPGDDTSQTTGTINLWSPAATMRAWCNAHPDAAACTADKTFPQGGLDLSQPDGFSNIGMNSGAVWPELVAPTPIMGGQHLAARFKVMNNISGFQNPNVGKYPLSTNMAAIISSADAQLQAEEEASPENAMQRSKTEQDEANANTADTNANLTRFNAGSAIDYTGTYIENFTVQDDNLWNTVRNQIFIPMAILILLPGAVLTQLKAIVSAGSPVVGYLDVLSPFDGILRAVVAIFLIPATYLFINYGIDLANSLTFTIADQYQQIFHSSMYHDAMCLEVRAFPVRNVSENLNYIPNQTSQMGMLGNSPGAMGGGPTPLAKFEGTNLEVKLDDPCAGIYIDPQDRANESVSYEVHAQRNIYNTANAGLAMTWNILCAFQVAYLYYLWFTGPIVAALWVYPMAQLRQAFGNWMAGVAAICFWSLFWNTVVLLMACLRGVDETGTMMATALNFLATASVKSAFDFAGLARSAGDQIGSMAKSSAAAAKGAGAGSKGQQGQKGGHQPAAGARPNLGSTVPPTPGTRGGVLAASTATPPVVGTNPTNPPGTLMLGGAQFGSPVVPAGMAPLSPNTLPPPLGSPISPIDGGPLAFLATVPSSIGGIIGGADSGLDAQSSLGLQSVFAGLSINPLPTTPGGPGATPPPPGSNQLPQLDAAKLHSLMHPNNPDGSLNADARSLATQIAAAGGAQFGDTTISAADMAAGNLPAGVATEMNTYATLGGDDSGNPGVIDQGDIILGDDISGDTLSGDTLLGDDFSSDTFLDSVGTSPLAVTPVAMAALSANNPPPIASPPPLNPVPTLNSASSVPLTGAVPPVGAGIQVGTGAATFAAAAATATRVEAQTQIQAAAAAQKEAQVAAVAAHPGVTPGVASGTLMSGSSVLAKEIGAIAQELASVPQVLTADLGQVGASVGLALNAVEPALMTAATSILPGATLASAAVNAAQLAGASDLGTQAAPGTLAPGTGATFASVLSKDIARAYEKFADGVALVGEQGVTNQVRQAAEGVMTAASSPLQSAVTGQPAALPQPVSPAHAPEPGVAAIQMASAAPAPGPTPGVGAPVTGAAVTGIGAVMSKEAAEFAAVFAPPEVRTAAGSTGELVSGLSIQGAYTDGTPTYTPTDGPLIAGLPAAPALPPALAAAGTVQPVETINLARAAVAGENLSPDIQLAAGSGFMQTVNDKIGLNYAQFNEGVANVGGDLARDQVRWSVDGVAGLATGSLSDNLRGVAAPVPVPNHQVQPISGQPAPTQIAEIGTASGVIPAVPTTPPARTEYTYLQGAALLPAQTTDGVSLLGTGVGAAGGQELVRDQLNGLADTIGSAPDVILPGNPAVIETGSNPTYLAMSSYGPGSAGSGYGGYPGGESEALKYDLGAVPLSDPGGILPTAIGSAFGAAAGSNLLSDNTGIVGQRINDRYEAQKEQFLDDRAQLARQGVHDAIEDGRSLAKSSLEGTLTNQPPPAASTTLASSSEPVVPPAPAAASTLSQALGQAVSPGVPEGAPSLPPNPSCFGVIARNRQDALHAVQGVQPDNSKKARTNVALPTTTEEQLGVQAGGQGGPADGARMASKLASALGRAATNQQSDNQSGGAEDRDANQRPSGSQVRSVQDPMGAVASGTTLRRWRQKRKASAEEMEAMRKLGGPDAE